MSTRLVESVWDYPRPPRVEPVGERVRVIVEDLVLADTLDAVRVLETSHPPTYYLPRQDLRVELLAPSRRSSSLCEWKGQARYWDVVTSVSRRPAAAWEYLEPRPGYEALRGRVAFYASRVDACWVGDERARPQEGDFYGGWIAAWVTGGERGFKGGPGTSGW